MHRSNSTITSPRISYDLFGDTSVSDGMMVREAREHMTEVHPYSNVSSVPYSLSSGIGFDTIDHPGCSSSTEDISQVSKIWNCVLLFSGVNRRTAFIVFSSFLSAPAGGLEPRLLPVLQTILLLQCHHGREYVGTPGDDVAFPTRRQGEDWRQALLDVACFWRETSRVLRRMLVATCLVTVSGECMRLIALQVASVL